MSVTSLHLFNGAKESSLQLLRHFGMLRIGLQRMSGLCFGRAMGCGQGAAFSLWPDWQRYVVMMECATAADEAAIVSSAAFAHLIEASKEHRRWHLKPVRKHGAWDGQHPFALEPDGAPDGPVAVLTRAAIALKQLPAFMRHSYQSTDALKAAPGLQFSIGMGEYPLVRQATFSIWESDAAMAAYAYNNQQHIAAMKAKVAGSMFTEEMFVRFRIG